MTALAEILARAPTDELVTAARLIHVAGVSQRRLLAAWGVNNRILEPGFPVVLAALCLDLWDERHRRGHLTPGCPSCNHLVAQALAGPSPDSAPLEPESASPPIAVGGGPGR